MVTETRRGSITTHIEINGELFKKGDVVEVRRLDEKNSGVRYGIINEIDNNGHPVIGYGVYFSFLSSREAIRHVPDEFGEEVRARLKQKAEEWDQGMEKGKKAWEYVRGPRRKSPLQLFKESIRSGINKLRTS